ncbi:hypothetical protein AYI69_g3332 [Smittium culicis]|uniref:Uncharacterized protein n=1 Tax=Smittium culicis TaxID=133412 RepID=A0A1R1YKI9_9FUNG|nr:hypothetical protein AYI69_g3332 [Smittium culicis]
MSANFDFISKYYPTLGHETATLVAVSCFTANNKPELLSGLINKIIECQCVDMSATEPNSTEYLKKTQLLTLIEKARETIFKNVFTVGLPLVLVAIKELMNSLSPEIKSMLNNTRYLPE